MNYIIFGEQTPRLVKQLKKVLKERLGTPDDFNVTKFDMDEASIDDVAMEIELLPLGIDRKAVVVDNVQFLSKGAKKEDVDRIYEAIKTPSDFVDVIFMVRKDTIDDKSPIVKEVQENGEIFNLINLKKEDWPIYTRKYFSNREVKIDDDAVEELILRVNGDLNRFINEADKLCLYKDHISLIDVTLMVSKPLEDNAFEICNALINGNNSDALAIYRDLKLISSKSTDTLIPLLASQFRFMSQVFYLYETGMDYNEIASELNAHPYRVKVTLGNRRRISRRIIAHSLDDLYYLDYQIKSGQIDRFYGLELFLINFPN